MPTPADLVVSALALVLGLFIAASPSQAAKLWSGDRLGKLTPQGRVWFLRCYRLLGVMIGLAGMLFALECFAASH